MQQNISLFYANRMNRLVTSPKYLILTLAWLLLLVSFAPQLKADCCGKIDVAPAILRIDVLEHGKTVRRMSMIGCRIDAPFAIIKGLCLKPNLLIGSGDGSIFNGSLGIGYYVPVQSWLALTPTIGCSYGNLRTHIHLPMFGLSHVKERFESISPYVGLEAIFKLATGLRFTTTFQYAWSRTHTTLKNILSIRDHSQGPNYGCVLEYDITNEWSVNVGAAYNISLSKEKHGIRAAGAKLGIARWF